mgnify:CR=1 FL=1
MPELCWAARTDVGRRRAKNEDAFTAATPIFAVADGMGGHARGDVAAAMAIDALRTVPPTFQRTELLEAIRQAHQEISRLAAETGGLGMGTTLTGIAFGGARDGALLVFNVGDSRVYRLRAGALEQLTHDHSVVQELLDAGDITEADIATHPERNVVTRSLGDGGHLAIDWHQTNTVDGDRYLVCSDGLVKEVDDDAIGAILADHDPTAAAEGLIERALANGGRDNVTVAVVEVIRARRTTDGEAGRAAAAPDADGIDADTNPRAAPRVAPGRGQLDVDTRPTAGTIGPRP